MEFLHHTSGVSANSLLYSILFAPYMVELCMWRDRERERASACVRTLRTDGCFLCSICFAICYIMSLFCTHIGISLRCRHSKDIPITTTLLIVLTNFVVIITQRTRSGIQKHLLSRRDSARIATSHIQCAAKMKSTIAYFAVVNGAHIIIGVPPMQNSKDTLKNAHTSRSCRHPKTACTIRNVSHIVYITSIWRDKIYYISGIRWPSYLCCGRPCCLCNTLPESCGAISKMRGAGVR